MVLPASERNTQRGWPLWWRAKEYMSHIVCMGIFFSRIWIPSQSKETDRSAAQLNERAERVARDRVQRGSRSSSSTVLSGEYGAVRRNWFFNYVPQDKSSNAEGCWWFAEAAARSLLRILCVLTYGVRLEYADPPLVASEAECYDAFRPSKMSLDLQIVRGDGVCEGMADEWSNKSLVEYDATSRALRTTRLMAYTLHEATLELDWIRIRHEKDLVGLLHVATAQPSVEQCDADAGAIFDFSSLTLRTDFQSAKLFVDNDCLTAASNSPLQLLIKGAANCASWRTAHDVNGRPQDLITGDNPKGLCITMTNMVLGFPQIDVATLTPTQPP